MYLIRKSYPYKNGQQKNYKITGISNIFLNLLEKSKIYQKYYILEILKVKH